MTTTPTPTPTALGQLDRQIDGVLHRTSGPRDPRDQLAHALIGNGRLLATLDEHARLQQLWWPHVDRDPQLGSFRLGIVHDGGPVWLDEPEESSQAYRDGTAALETTLTFPDGIVTVTDAVGDQPVVVRHIDGFDGQLIVHVRPAIGGMTRAGGAYVHPDHPVLVFYRGERAIAVGTNTPAAAWVARSEQGGEAIAAALANRGDRLAFGHIEGALVTSPATSCTLTIALGDSPDTAVGRVLAALVTADVVEPHDGGSPAVRRRITVAPSHLLPEVARLDERSQQVLELLTDRQTGGIIAAPECDEDFHISGGYGYVWPRDVAYIVLGLLAADRHDLAKPALQWLARAQSADGLWLQRHTTDGHLGPSWGTQLDETGAVLFAYQQAWQRTADHELDRNLWPSATAAAHALEATLDPTTSLPAPSRDLWEERLGVHTYTAAAVCAGLHAAAAMATRHDPSLADGWSSAALRIEAAIDRHLWSEEHGRYLRSINVARADNNGAPPPASYELRGHPEQPIDSVDLSDATVDVSLLGLTYPFRILPADNPRMRATIGSIESALATSDGGLLRYEDDDYAGGNPWVLARLWLGLARREPGSAQPADGIDYALRAATTTGMLPEQVDAATGEPAWVVPLAWSHAMYLLACRPDPDTRNVMPPAAESVFRRPTAQA